MLFQSAELQHLSFKYKIIKNFILSFALKPMYLSTFAR